MLRALTVDEVETLSSEAVRPGAILPVEQAHFVTWLGSAEDTRARVGLPSFTPTDADVESSWTLNLGVVHRGEPVGQVTLKPGGSWPEKPVVSTNSWLLARAQRQGVGTAARVAAVSFAFDCCGADVSRSHVLVENAASIRLSERLGYLPIVRKSFEENGRALTEIVFEVAKVNWQPNLPVEFGPER